MGNKRVITIVHVDYGKTSLTSQIISLIGRKNIRIEIRYEE